MPSPRRSTRVAALVLAWLAGSASAQVTLPTAAPAPAVQATSPNAPSAAPVYWPRRELMIPYRWSGATAGAEVVLYYSPDQGRSWRVAGSGAPHVRSFRFLAPSDGEHCFAIRTYDSLGVATPAGPLAPEMRVVVDTSGPQVDQMDASITDGLLSVALSASDPAGFGATPAYVYVQAAGQPGWTPATVTSADRLPDGRTLRLACEWRPPAGATEVAVRATVEDRAGNRTERSTSARVEATAAATPTPVANPFALANPYAAPGAATRPSPQVAASQQARPSTTAALDPFAAAERRAATQAAPQPPSGQSLGRLASQHLPATPGPGFDLNSFSTPRPERSRPDPAHTATPWPADPKPTRSLAAPAPRAAKGGPFSSASFAPTPTDPFGSWSDSSGGGVPKRFVNSAQFEFDYSLEESGRWGVSKVELWGTDNGGRSWRRFAIDSDRQSPIHVVAPGAGEYGFKLVVESVGGLDAPTPRPGDQPEAIVGVDLQAPFVALSDVRQGIGYFADQLVIDWRADDEHLAEQPIDLYYSNRATGPWMPIATAQPNSGRHTWRLQRHLPRQLYVRVEARDAAGNTASAVTPEPVALDVATASGSLRGVRPSGN